MGNAPLDLYANHLLESLQPTPAVRNRLQDSYDFLKSLVSNGVAQQLQVQEPGLQLYGSFSSGFYNCHSDLDVVLVGKYRGYLLSSISPNEKYRMLNHLKTAMVHNPFVVDAVAIDCRVPILKIKTANGTEIDFGIGSEKSSLKSEIVAVLRENFPAFQTLYPLVKAWAKAHELNNGYAKTANSFCLLLMVVFYLQQEQIMPPLWRLLTDRQPALNGPKLFSFPPQEIATALKVVKELGAELGETFRERNTSKTPIQLLEGFFDFTRVVLAFRDPSRRQRRRCTRMLSALHGELLPVPTCPGYYLYVEDPFEDYENCARTFGAESNRFRSHATLDYLSYSLEHAVDVMAQARRHPSFAGLPAAVLAYLFGPRVLLQTALIGNKALTDDPSAPENPLLSPATYEEIELLLAEIDAEPDDDLELRLLATRQAHLKTVQKLWPQSLSARPSFPTKPLDLLAPVQRRPGETFWPRAAPRAAPRPPPPPGPADLASRPLSAEEELSELLRGLPLV